MLREFLISVQSKLPAGYKINIDFIDIYVSNHQNSNF